MANVQIDQRALMIELSTAEPILKKEAERVMREEFFLPAVRVMSNEFEQHAVTREIDEGVEASNVSETLPDGFASDDGKNLYSFIGFEELNPTKQIRDRLSPNHPDGPRIVYKGMDKNRLDFRFEVKAPNEAAIYANTPMPWAPGISWAKRIEIGIAGVGGFLNGLKKPGSRSGGGIQIENQIRSGRFANTQYLTSIFKNFLANVTRSPSNRL